MTIRSGYGFEPLHLRQPASELRSRFGAPLRRRKSDNLREYWFYSNLGFECLVSRKSQRVLSIFLSQESTSARNLFPAEASLPFGMTQEQVRALFGQPNAEGGGFTMTDGTWVGHWYTYDTGIGFDFNEEGRVTTLSIFARKRVAHATSHASIAGASGRGIAALKRR